MGDVHMYRIDDRDDLRVSPAQRSNRGVGVPRPYTININSRCNYPRNCRHCGGINEHLIKVGLRSYAHKSCFEKKYGPLENLPVHTYDKKETPNAD